MPKLILMTKENPTGQKLEELLETLQFELALKTLRLAGDGCKISSNISRRNAQILELLAQSQSLQEENMKEVEEFFKRPSDPERPRITPEDSTDKIRLMFRSAEMNIGMVGCFSLETTAIDIGLMKVHDKAELTDFGHKFHEWLKRE